MLINKYKQFNLNYSTIHIFSQKYFVNTIHMNSETLRLLFTANHPTSVPLCEPEIYCHFRLHTHRNTIYCINHATNTQFRPYTATDCAIGFHNFFTLRFQYLGPIKRPFKTSNKQKHHKALKSRVKQVEKPVPTRCPHRVEQLSFLLRRNPTVRSPGILERSGTHSL